jgi:hypothetical protein
MLGGEMDVLEEQRQNLRGAFCERKPFESDLSSGHISSLGNKNVALMACPKI